MFWTFCESHATDVSFHAVTRLLWARMGVADLDGYAARAKVRQQIPDADPQDLLLLDDLLGIADPKVPLPQLDPDARRRRLTASWRSWRHPGQTVGPGDGTGEGFRIAASGQRDGFAMQYGMLRADDSALRAGEDAVHTAQRASSDLALVLAAYTLAVGLLNRDAAADRHRGLELMMQARDIWHASVPFLIPVTDLWTARETARHCDRDAAIGEMRQAVDKLRQAGHLGYGLLGSGVLVEALLERGAEGDLAEAQEAFDWLVNLPQRRFGGARDHAAAAARATSPGPRRRHCPPRLGRSAIARWRNRLASKGTSPGPDRLSGSANSRDLTVRLIDG